MRRAACLGVVALLGCQRDISDARLVEMSLAAEREAHLGRSAEHDGPTVAVTADGTARFAARVLDAFEAERALATAAYADRYYREPGNEGFDAVIDHLESELRSAGYGADPRSTLAVIETPMESPAWTPRSARLELVADAGVRVLHSFAAPEDRDRTMLPRNAPAARVEGPLATALDAVVPGSVLLVDAPLRAQLLADARARGAVLVLSADLAEYNVDPSPGGRRHEDAIAYRHVSYPAPLPVAQVSPRVARTLRAAALASDSARVRFEADVAFAERPLRTLVATVVGSVRPDECVAVAAHVQEPGACDNASGVGTLLEAARVALTALERPARSVVFVFGDEMTQSRVFLEHTPLFCIAALAADMTGESAERTGATALLERAPDPGARVPLPPDRHTAWVGNSSSRTPPAPPASEAAAGEDEFAANGLAVVARCALVDVGLREKGWKTAEHPFEGGSDHSVFLARGIPAVLFWHFTDFAYHTSLDRMEHVDAAEMRRMGSALLTTAFAIADARPSDMQRYLTCLQREITLRTQSASEAGDPDTARRWREWSTGARMWLRALCLGEPRSKPI